MWGVGKSQDELLCKSLRICRRWVDPDWVRSPSDVNDVGSGIASSEGDLRCSNDEGDSELTWTAFERSSWYGPSSDERMNLPVTCWREGEALQGRENLREVLRAGEAAEETEGACPFTKCWRALDWWVSKVLPMQLPGLSLAQTIEDMEWEYTKGVVETI